MQSLRADDPPPSQRPVSTTPGESKSARKKKAKAEAAGNGTTQTPVVPVTAAKEDSSIDTKDHAELATDHPYLKDLHKQIRNINKKLSGMQKTDTIIAEHPDLSLDDLVAKRMINADQKASALKKPELQAQLGQLEGALQQYHRFDTDYQSQMQKQRDELTAQYQKDLQKATEDLQLEGATSSAAGLRKKLLVFSQFLRCAAHKRGDEDVADTDEGRAFEGALLLVYGGDQKAVDAAMNLVDGTDEQVPGIDGVPTPIKYSQIHQASVEHTPFQAEEEWVDNVAQASAAGAETQDMVQASAAGAETTEISTSTSAPPAGSDPTVTHAGLTEIDTSAKTNGVPAEAVPDVLTSPPTGATGDEAGNAAGDRWDTSATSAEAETTGAEDSLAMLPRPQDELETPASGAPAAVQQERSTSWADEPPAYDTADTAATGNQAGENWDLKPAGEQTDTAWSGGSAAAAAGATVSGDGWTDGAADAAPGASQEDGDGFHPVPGRHRGRGRGRGDGEFRGRGRGRGGFRGGDGEFRGRGRGGFRGRGEGGEHRGRGGGRGRGPRGGGGEGQARGD